MINTKHDSIKILHRKKLFYKGKKGDFFLIIAVTVLTFVGTVFIYSASNYSAKSTYNDSFYFVKKQVIGIVIGIVCMIVACNFDYHKLVKFALPLCAITIILLSLVFVPKIGVENYGAKRWIKVGSFTLQPSEIAKFSLILFSAFYISKNPEKARTLKGVLPIIMYGIIVCILIMLEPNMSITACVASLMCVILFAGGLKIKTMLLLFIPAFIGGVVLIVIEPYRFDRLVAFLNPWSNPRGEGYQLIQSLYGLGSGGLFGVGLFNSRQKFAFLPFAESDFILSVIGEEIGYIGLVLFFVLLFFIVYRGIKITSMARDLFGYILSIGITMIFGIQVVINALVVTGSIPPTGLSLPLVSSGNTSIIIFMTEMGVLFNVSKQGTLTF